MSEITRVPTLQWEESQEKRERNHDNPAEKHPNEVTGRSESDLEASLEHKTGIISDSGSILVNDRDVRHKQKFGGLLLAWLTYQSIGVIYGDIGTSPLYVYSSTFTSPPNHEDLVGCLSLIIWSLTLMVSVKYVGIVLRADDEGEGGTFALFSLLTRYSNIVERDPRAAQLIRMKRYRSNELKAGARPVRSQIENSAPLKFFIQTIAIVGVALIIADGVLTPSQTVLGAIEGFKVANPNITQSTILGGSCGVLVFLFLIQPFGTSKLATTFAPIVIIWLLSIAASGIYNLAVHDHSVLKAFSPTFAIKYFINRKTEGWKSLGGVLLAFTGVEVMYADLGAFTLRAVSYSWLFFGYPCLLLAYIGQAAYISRFPDAYSNPVFATVPPHTFWPMEIIACLAAIVASQATITGVFQLLSQVINSNYFPKIKVIHTSTRVFGQLYIPVANWLMMIGCIIVTCVYNDTVRLGNAYGTCVMLVTTITTYLVAIAALIVWRLHVLIVLPPLVFFAVLDGLFLSSALTKVPDGAWFTLMLAAVLSFVLLLWRYGKTKQWNAEGLDKLPPADIVRVAYDPDSKSEQAPLYLTESFGGRKLATMKGCGVYFDKGGDKAPAVYTHFLHKFEAHHELTIFFHLRSIQAPSVPPEEQYTVTKLSIPHTYRILVRYGYNEHVVSHHLAEVLHTQLTHFLTTKPEVHEGNTPEERNMWIERELAYIEHAFSTQAIYIVGQEQLKIRDDTNIVRRILISAFLWLRENTRKKVVGMKVPVDRLVEVGFVKQI